SERDFSSLTDVSCWNLTAGRMVPHFSRTNCAVSLSRKARGFSVGRRCCLPIQINVHDSNRSGRDIALRCPDAAARRPYHSQFPVCAVPAQHLLHLCDVFREKIAEENLLLPIHRPLVWNHVSVFIAPRTKRFETEKRKDGGERFALLVSKVFKLHRFYLLARKEFEQTLELLPVKSSVDVSKAARFSRRRARNAILFVSHGIE